MRAIRGEQLKCFGLKGFEVRVLVDLPGYWLNGVGWCCVGGSGSTFVSGRSQTLLNRQCRYLYPFACNENKCE